MHVAILPNNHPLRSLTADGKGVNALFARAPQDAGSGGRPMRILCLIVALFWCGPAVADLRITRDFGGYVDQYKDKYTKLKSSGERVIAEHIERTGHWRHLASNRRNPKPAGPCVV